MSDLSSLIARLEAAEWPSHELDRLIASVVLGRSIGVSKWTASLDAAVSLAERVLPGWRHAYEKRTDGTCLAWVDAADDEPALPSVARTPAISLVLATLRALQQKGSANG